MVNYYLLAVIVTVHFIFDWILQPRIVAKTKKKDSDRLNYHLAYNILPLYVVIWFLLFGNGYSVDASFTIVSINYLSHYFIDKYLPSGKNEREIINWTAIDQILHLGILILSLNIK